MLESWYSKLFHDAKIFFVFWRFFELLIFEQKSCIFSHIKKYHFSSLYQKNIFLWKHLVALIILQKRFCQKLPSLIRFWHSELHTQFQPLKIIHFSFKILTKSRKFTWLKITLIFRPPYCHQFSHFFPKTFLQNNQCNYEFSQKKIFFDTNWRNDIFWYRKKIHDFVQKFITQKIFKIQKKILHHEKV